MKKIVHFIHGLNTGGAETLVKNYCLGLDKSKYDVTVLCYERFDSPYDKILFDAGIKVLYACDRIKLWGRKDIAARVINHYQLYFVLRRMLRELNPDILHTHLLVNKYVKFAGLSKNTRVFYTIHTQINKLWPVNLIGRNADLSAAKWLVKKRGMRLITLYDGMKQEANELFNVNNSVVLNNGVNFEAFEHAKGKGTMRAELGIPQDAFVVGHVGRFSEVKNHRFLVDVFKEIYKRNDKAFLLMVGDGEDKESIKSRLDEASLNNHYLILSNRNDVADIMNAMDVFVFPSLYEGFGIVLVEAQKSGLPCFVSDAVPSTAKVTDLVRLLSLNNGAEFWAQAVHKYCQIKSEAIKSGKIDVPIDWDISNVIKRLEQIYDGVI